MLAILIMLHSTYDGHRLFWPWNRTSLLKGVTNTRWAVTNHTYGPICAVERRGEAVEWHRPYTRTGFYHPSNGCSLQIDMATRVMMVGSVLIQDSEQCAICKL